VEPARVRGVAPPGDERVGRGSQRRSYAEGDRSIVEDGRELRALTG
jgi:hypothetical protein